jgi:hypothetical protein
MFWYSKYCTSVYPYKAYVFIVRVVENKDSNLFYSILFYFRHGTLFSYRKKFLTTLPLKVEHKWQTHVGVGGGGEVAVAKKCTAFTEECETKIVSWVSPTWHTGISEYKWIKCRICGIFLSAPHVA